MADYVRNKIYFFGPQEEKRKLHEFMSTEENEFDFNQLIKMPEDLNLEDGSDYTVAMACLKAREYGMNTCDIYEFRPWAQKRMDFSEWVDLGRKYKNNKEKYGHYTWYGWRVENWGTKWNACDAKWDGNNSVQFDTAYEMPLPIFKSLAEKFPSLIFEVEFAAEDLDSGYSGRITYKGKQGARSVSVLWDGSYDFACEVWGVEPDEYHEVWDEAE